MFVKWICGSFTFDYDQDYAMGYGLCNGYAMVTMGFLYLIDLDLQISGHIFWDVQCI